MRTIEPATRRVTVRDLPRTAAALRMIVARDFAAKYKQSLLGPAWVAIQPLALLVGLVVGFRGVVHVSTAGAPYALFALAGLSVWSYVQAALTMGAAAFLTNTTLVVRTSAPRVAFPISALLATAPTLGLTLLTTVALSAAAGQLGPRALLLPAALVWLVALVGALVLLASTLAVWFRDVLQALPFALQVGVFLAPVGYPLGRLSGTLAAVLRLDPLTGLIELVRWSLLSSQPLDGAAVAIGLGVTAMLLVAGWQLFVRAEVRMADVI